MITKYVYQCKGDFGDNQYNLPTFADKLEAIAFCLGEQGGTFSNLYYVEIPLYTSYQEWKDN